MNASIYLYITWHGREWEVPAVETSAVTFVSEPSGETFMGIFHGQPSRAAFARKLTEEFSTEGVTAERSGQGILADRKPVVETEYHYLPISRRAADDGYRRHRVVISAESEQR
jgi:hypothetical protein